MVYIYMYMGRNCKNMIILKFYIFIWNVTGVLLFLFAKSGNYDQGVQGRVWGFFFVHWKSGTNNEPVVIKP